MKMVSLGMKNPVTIAIFNNQPGRTSNRILLNVETVSKDVETVR